MRRNARSAGAEPAFRRQMARKQALLDGARHAQFFFDLLLLALFLEQARVFEHGRRLDGQRLQQFAISAGEIGCQVAGVHVEDAHRVVVRGEYAGLLPAAGLDVHQRHADHAQQIEFGYAVFRVDFTRGLGIEVHGEQLPAQLQRAVDDAPRHPQIGFRQALAVLIASHFHGQAFAVAQQQEPALSACDRQRRVDHGVEHVVGRKGTLQRARHLQHSAQLGQAPAHAGPRCLLTRHLLHEPFQLGAVQRKDQLVRIGHAELDAVGIVQPLALDALSIHIHAMPAAQILDRVFAVCENDLGVVAGGAAVAQDQMAVGLAADLERHGLDFNARAVAVGIDHDQRSGTGGRRSAF